MLLQCERTLYKTYRQSERLHCITCYYPFLVAAIFRASDKVLYSSRSGFFYHASLPDKGESPHPTPHTSALVLTTEQPWK